MRHRHHLIGIDRFVLVLEFRVLTAETQPDGVGSTITVFSNDDLCQTAEVFTGLVIVIEVVVLGSVDEADHVGILLDGTGLTQVRELRRLAFHTLTGLDTTVELREGDDRYIQLFCQSFEASRDDRDLLLTATEGRTLCVHELQVVDDDKPDAVLANELTRFGAELEDRERRGVVQVERRTFHDVDLRVQTTSVFFGHLTGLDLIAFEFADVHDQTVHELYVTHLQ